MSQGTDTKYFPQMQMVCHPATEWHTAHLWATHTLAPAQKHARLFQIRIKAGDCTNCRAIRYEKCFSDTNGLQFSYDTCTPLHTPQLRACPKMPDQSGLPFTLQPQSKVRAEVEGDVATVARSAVEGPWRPQERRPPGPMTWPSAYPAVPSKALGMWAETLGRRPGTP